MADPFDEFEFKPLTEGLGFHKKAEKIKLDIQSADLAHEKMSRVVPDVPPPSMLNSQPDAAAGSSIRHSFRLGSQSASVGALTGGRPPAALSVSAPVSDEQSAQSISDLIASLPPSLDFLDEKEANVASAAPVERPQIFQPLARDDDSIGATARGATLGSVLGNGVGRSAPGGGVTWSETKIGATALSISSGIPASVNAGMPGIPGQGSAPSSPYRERMNESFARSFPHAEKSIREQRSAENGRTVEEALQPVAAHLASGLLDGMVVAGTSTILLVCILVITRINLFGMLTNARTDTVTQINLGLLFIAVLLMYLLISRSFAGASLGEWAFDLQMGDTDQQKRWTYPLQVIWRTILVTATGLIFFPLLSLIFRRDLLKYLTGLQLYRRS